MNRQQGQILGEELARTSPKEVAFGDVQRELEVTRRVLERLPDEQFGWKPHEKSMSLGQLALHVATLPHWMQISLERDGLDMAAPPELPRKADRLEDVLAVFDKTSAAALAALERLDAAELLDIWTLRQGDKEIYGAPRWKVLRLWSVNHLVHHRAQLCVYLRLLNVPVPTVYFNTADDPNWVFE